MRFAIDVDGVLADFNSVYAKMFPKLKFDLDDPDFPSVWDWPEAAGATEEEVSAVWEEIKADPDFWRRVPPMESAMDDIELLNHAVWEHDHEVFFITKRVGQLAQQQTAWWLRDLGFDFPTVIVCGRGMQKGPICNALQIDAIIDDKPSNLRGLTPGTRRYLRDASYNRGCHEFIRVTGIEDFLKREGISVELDYAPF